MRHFTVLVIYLVLVLNANSDTIDIKNSLTSKIKIDSNNVIDTSINKKIDYYEIKDTVKVKVYENEISKRKKKNPINIDTLFGIILGFLLNNGYEYFSEKRRINRIGKRWIAQLRSLEGPISEQMKSIDEFLKKHNEDKFETPIFLTHQLLDCDIFKSLDSSDLLNFLQRKKETPDAIEISNDVHRFISYLKSVYNEMINRFKVYIKQTSEYFELFNDQINDLNYRFGQYTLLLEERIGKPENEGVFREINHIFERHLHPHLKDGNVDIFHLHNEFIMPLLEILAKNRFNKDLKDFGKYLTKCDQEIKSIKMEKKYLRENFNVSHKLFDNSIKRLKDILKNM